MQSKSQPLVSVVIPCYNHAQYVQDCIQSVINQTYKNIELIIIDDGSNDSSVEKIQAMVPLCKERFTRFEYRYRSNKGLSSTLNEALQWCRGEYYAGFASDDIMLISRIEKQVNFFKQQNSDIYGVFGGYQLIDNNNNVLKIFSSDYKEYYFNDIILHRFNLAAPTALLRLDKVIAVGGYNPNLKIEDWYMWLKLTEYGGKLICLKELLCQYRSHNENISKKMDVIYTERHKVLNQFKRHKKYIIAKINIEWYKVTDSLNNNKKNAFSEMISIIKKYPMEIFSRNMFRFIYYFFKSFKK